ncbi:RDD family protein [Porphyrobacter sp. YT40]|uniref:RDD family protein n=1 Tax=Porphyrobacter sp. YT40 TaxID=2547601 RepID=UPI0011446136|nr:RDD family protein [Porphyrobacter sp. YT40]QDH33001.1 RDD family protein [Porphyrobacter sp. YT40]
MSRKPAALPADRRARTMITPEGLALPVTIAPRASRAGALIIDVMIIVFGLIVFQMVMRWIAGGLMDSTGFDLEGGETGAFEFLIILFALVVFVTWYGYFLVQELGPRGATLGKRIVGIRVAARGGARLTPEAVIARNLLRDIEIFYPLITLAVLLVLANTGQDIGILGWVAAGWFALFLLFPFFNRDSLRAGDIVAGTWVVDRPRTKLAQVLSTQGAAAANGASEVTGARYDFGEAELSVYGEKELQTLERMLRDAQPDALKAVHAAICRKIGWDPGAGDERAFLEAFYAQLRAKLEGDMRFGKRKADKHS